VLQINLSTTHASKLAFVAGAPSHLLNYVTYLSSEILRRSYGSARSFGFNDASAETMQGFEDQTPGKVIYMDCPDAAATAVACSAQHPLVYVEEAVENAVWEFAQTRSVNINSATINILQCLAALEPIRRCRRGVTLSADGVETALDLAKAVAHSIGINAADWLAIESDFLIACRLTQPVRDAVIEFNAHAQKCQIGASDEDRNTLAVLRSGLTFEKGALIGMNVPFGLLLSMTNNGDAAGMEFDLTGPARCLTFGPYVSLPAGEWSAKITFQTWENESVNTLVFDITDNGNVIISKAMDFSESGTYALQLPFILDNVAMIEIRTHLKFGAIRGGFQLLGMQIERTAPPS